MKKLALILALTLGLSQLAHAQGATPAGGSAAAITATIAAALALGIILVFVGFDDEGNPIFITGTATGS